MRSILKHVDMTDIKLNVFSDACSVWIRSYVNIVSAHLSSYVISYNMMKIYYVQAALKTGVSSFVQLYFLP